MPEGAPNTALLVEEVPKAPLPQEASRPGEATTGSPPPLHDVDSGAIPRPVRDVYEMQLALSRLGFSPGPVDGVDGSQTQSALRAFQIKEGLPATGILDPRTRDRLRLTVPPYATRIVTASDLALLRPLSPTWLGKSKQDRLDYESILELAAELSLSHPKLLQRLNPDLNWESLTEGTPIKVPNATWLKTPGKAAQVRVQLGNRTLQALDSDGRVLAHYPCSIARRVDKRPLGELRVVTAIADPNYTFNPDYFPESDEARRLKRKLVLPPGPNNPVGVAWIGLDRPGYGIHGTPVPESVGRTESHGCFRLANWNARHLLELVWVGMPVFVEP